MVRWTDINESDFPWELAALDYLKEHLPDREPYRGWGPFEFNAGESGWPEVDSLVVAPHAIFVIEIKSWRGELRGGERDWQLPSRSEVNPMPKTNKKAVQLKSKLAKTRAVKQALRGRPMPRVEALVFFSEEDFICGIGHENRQGLVGIDRSKRPTTRQGGELKGVIETIEAFPAKGTTINMELSEALAAGMEELELRPSGRFAKIGKFVIESEQRLSDDEESLECAAHAEVDERLGTCRIAFRKALSRADGSGMLAAERAADREFRLLFRPESHHPGIAQVGDVDLSHPWGPALVYRLDASAPALAEFLANDEHGLEVSERLGIFRRLIEAMRHAHSRHLVHRSLRPEVIYMVWSPDGYWQPVISGWQTGLRAEESGAAVTGTVHFLAGGESAKLFRAPEVDSAENPDPTKFDSYSLGALGYLILTGVQPPGRNSVDLSEAANELFTQEDAETLGDYLVVLDEATRPDPAERASVLELAEYFFEAEQDRSVAAVSAVEVVRDRDSVQTEKPLVPELIAARDSVGEYSVVRRLGSGSSAVAFLAKDKDGRQGVLKVAASVATNGVIANEALALTGLRSSSVAELFAGPQKIGGRQAIFVEYADRATLRDVIEKGEENSVAVIKEWGSALHEGLDELERMRVFHRDLKPDNIGLTSKADAERPLIFDFSLSRAEFDVAALGTRGYVDPFATQRGGYDHAADRYSLAVVLHELLTGKRPTWGDGTADPASVECKLLLGSDSFPRQSVAPLEDFFQRALAESLDARFSSAREMMRAWEAALDAESVEGPENPSHDDSAASEHHKPLDQLAKLGSVLVLGGSRDGLRLAFRKVRSRVTREEQIAVEDALSDIPLEDRAFDKTRLVWKVAPTPASAVVVRALIASNAVEVRASARDLIQGEEPPETQVTDDGEVIELGDFLIHREPACEPFTGTTISNQPNEPGTRWIYTVEGPEGIRLRIADERFENEERHIELLEGDDLPKHIIDLAGRVRPGISKHGGKCFARLDLARPKAEGARPTMVKATIDDLNSATGLDVEELLRLFGAESIGSRVKLLGDDGKPNSHKFKLHVKFDEDSALLPIVLFMLTRVLPEQNRAR